MKVKSIWVCAFYEKSEEVFLKVKLKFLILKAFGQVEWKIESTGVGLAEAGSELLLKNCYTEYKKYLFERSGKLR